MGDRCNLVLIYPGGERLFLYTHWRGAHLAAAARTALRNGRWDDPAYLARGLFDALREGDDDPLGYGISPYRTWPDRDELHVDCGAREIVRVTLDHVFSEEGVELFERPVERWTFYDFAEARPGVLVA